MSGQTSSQRRITIVDHRRDKPPNAQKQYIFKLLESDNCSDLLDKLIEKTGGQNFVITDPNRIPLDKNNYLEMTANGSTLWLLNDFSQRLKDSVAIPINHSPHFHTITQSGMYEYYDSRGIDSLVISLAELIDNSLAATKGNDGLRHIEIRYYDNGSDSMVIIIDNGHGMDFNGLWDWARFKYSKFERKKKPESCADESGLSVPDSGNFSFCSDDLPLRPPDNSRQNHIPDPKDRRPRYLDSEINYFGAGGKQAIFNIGTYTTMISKTAKSGDIYELTLSDDKFKAKAEKDLESVYKDDVFVRSKGVEREIDENAPISEVILNEVVKEIENDFQSFTICFIKNIPEKHQKNFKKNSENEKYWTRGLARIYHYYLHGPKGNLPGNRQQVLPPDLKDIGIIVKTFGVEKKDSGLETTRKYTIDLKEIYDDFETLLVQTAADTFEFEVEHFNKQGIVIEGIVRYHPYLYDRETLPLLDEKQELGETASEASVKTGATDNQIDEVLNPSTSKTERREVFECFWHGRLIPQDCINFEWNKFDPKNANIKGYEECFNRLSGALFTNHAFKVSQNKQSFMDLNKLMAQRDHLTFHKLNDVGTRHGRRVKFENEFINWIKMCHNKYDKQVLYKEYQGDSPRSEFPSLKKNSLTDTYSVFAAIHWRDRDWKMNEMIQTQNTKPQGLIGQINRFLIPKCNRNASGNFMGPPGYVEINILPEEINGKGVDAIKIISFKQINVEATEQMIGNELQKLHEKLPETLEVIFPEGHAIAQGDKIIAGSPIGAIQVIVKSVNGLKLPSDRIPYKSTNKKMYIQVDIQKPSQIEDDEELYECEVAYDLVPFSKEWDYYTKQLDKGIEKVGKYRLICGCVTTKSGSKDADTELIFPNEKLLPSSDPIHFEVIAGPAMNFSIINKQLRALIGKPFDLTLKFTDKYENQTTADFSLGLPELKMNERFKVSFVKFEPKSAVIRDVVISGPITENLNPILKVSFLSIKKSQELGVILQKGVPHQIRLLSTKFEFINGEVPELGALLFDKGGNEVTFDKPYSVFCKIFEKQTKVAVSPEYSLIENMHDSRRALCLHKEVVIKGTEIPFNLRKFFIRFYMKTLSDVVFEKDLIVKKNSKPSYIKLYFTNTVGDNSEAIEIPNGGSREFPANSHLAGVHFKAFDCDDTPIDLNDFENQVVNINWHNKPFLITSNGCLPNIHVHTNSSEERLMTFLWKQERRNVYNVEYSFTLRAYADSAQRMAINTNSHSLLFPLGVVVTQSIQVSVFDAYNNTIRSPDIMRRLIIKPVTQKLIVDDKSLKKVIPRLDNNVLQNSVSFVITNIKLIPNPNLTENDSVIGQTRVYFSIRGLEEINETIDINVGNGQPSALKWTTPQKCVTIMNNKRLDMRLQLCDEYNNPVVDNKLPIALFLGKNFVKEEISVETDENGVASFQEHIHMVKNKIPMWCAVPTELEADFKQRCSQKCFGFYKIDAKTKYKNKAIKSDNHWLHITCDNKSPVRLVYIKHGDAIVTTKSDKMPYFTVRLYAEDNNLIKGFDSAQIKMHLINMKDTTKYQDFVPSKVTQDTFYFRVDRAPLPNPYKVKFLCNGIETFCDQRIDVIPDSPVKLSIRSQQLKDVTAVTNFGPKRQILESPLILDLVDRNNISIYDNICERDLDNNPLYSGTLTANIHYFSDTDLRTPVPNLEGCHENQCLQFRFKRGRIIIKEDQLRLEEYTTGVTNTKYRVVLKVYFEDEELNRIHIIEPLFINILFCDDTERQQQLNDIQNNISIHKKQKNDLRKELDSKLEQLKDQRAVYYRVYDKERNIINKLNFLGETSDLTDAQQIQSKINEYQQIYDDLKAEQSDRIFRGQEISEAPQMEGVLGRIAHLAHIGDETSARSISWYLRNHMNCVVVKTEPIAEKLREEYGIESTLSLDMIPPFLPSFVGEFLHDPHPEWRKPPLFTASHRINFIRNRLQMNENFSDIKNDLENVFTSILRDSLFIFDIQKAKQYRENIEIKCKRHCPSIVTKDSILHDNGIIESVPKDDNFVWFQSPPDRHFIKIQKILENLKDLVEVHEERVEKRNVYDGLKLEFQRLDDEKSEKIKELNQTIDENTKQFADISQTALVLDEDSNQSNYSLYRRSSESHKRRRSYDRRSRSKSGEYEPKRFRQS